MAANPKSSFVNKLTAITFSNILQVLPSKVVVVIVKLTPLISILIDIQINYLFPMTVYTQLLNMIEYTMVLLILY